MAIKKYLIIICLVLISNTPLAAGVNPSFDCSRATTVVENAICADSELARIDQALAGAYKVARAAVEDKKSLAAQQKKWISTMTSTCSSAPSSSIKECTQREYEKRIISLQQIYQDPAGSAQSEESLPTETASRVKVKIAGQQAREANTPQNYATANANSSGQTPLSVTPSSPPIEVDQDIVVEAEGMGETKLAALKNAWAEAVRLGIGMYLTSKTAVVDEDIMEEIVTHSRGKVNAYEEISAEKGESGWTVSIRARIEKDILQETAAAVQSKSIRISDDVLAAAKSGAAANISNEQKKTSAANLIQTMSFPQEIDTFITIDNVTSSVTDGKLVAKVALSVNMDAYKKEILTSLCNILDQVAISNTTKFYADDIVMCNGFIRKNIYETVRTNSPYLQFIDTTAKTCGRDSDADSGLTNTISIEIDKARYAVYKVSNEILQRFENKIPMMRTGVEGKATIGVVVETLSGEEVLSVNSYDIFTFAIFRNGRNCLQKEVVPLISMRTHNKGWVSLQKFIATVVLTPDPEDLDRVTSIRANLLFNR